MAKETNEILGHGDEADGIEEYDNPLPDWWLGLFFLTVVYGVGYAVNYHFIAEDSQEKRYLAQMEEAEQRWPTPEAAEFEMSPQLVSAGTEVFAQTCASCHGAELQGGIGPNLVDSEWIHGGEPDQIIATITNGVTEKGMPAWGPVLGPQKVQEVTAFIVSKGTGEAPVADAAPSGDEGVADGTPADNPDGDGSEEVVADAGDMKPEVEGAKIYNDNCAACHGPDMTGLVGPSLVDAEWIHGGELDDIRRTIRDGVPEKGMVQWGPILGEQKIDLVARYVQLKSSGTL
jgi:cytochrome c oxidase cbb3-type subunit 3